MDSERVIIETDMGANYDTQLTEREICHAILTLANATLQHLWILNGRWLNIDRGSLANIAVREHSLLISNGWGGGFYED